MSDQIQDAGPVEQVSEAPAPEFTPSSNVQDAVDRAWDAPEPGQDASEAPDEGHARDERGRFAAKEAGEKPVEGVENVDAKEQPENTEPPKEEAPSRFTPEAREAWNATPEPVRAEITRAIGEMEKGIAGYREMVEPLRPWMDMAQQNNTTIPQALESYVSTERLLMQDPVAGMHMLAERLGTTLEDIYYKSLDRPAEMNKAQAELAQHQYRIEAMEREKQQFEQQQFQRQLEEFASTHPRFEELRQTMGQIMQAGMAKDLEEAYVQADRLNPAPQPAPAPQQQQPAQPAQTRQSAANLSVRGAPGDGSNPSAKMRSKSVTDAVDKAFVLAGL